MKDLRVVGSLEMPDADGMPEGFLMPVGSEDDDGMPPAAAEEEDTFEVVGLVVDLFGSMFTCL